MNWTGGRRARHNSNASLNTASRLQKQYFAKVRMARGSAQDASKLIRSSSPIELVEPVRKRARGNTPKEHTKFVSSFGMGMLQGKRGWTVRGRGPAMIKQGVERKKKNDINKSDCHLGRDQRSNLFALESGENSTKSKNLGDIKRLLLEKEDWLGTRDIVVLRSEDEEERADSHQEFSSSQELLHREQPISEDGPTALENEGIDELPKPCDGGIDQQYVPPICHGRTYYPPHPQADSQSTYIRVGNARISDRRDTYRNTSILTQPPRGLRDTVQENFIDDIATSDSMLLNFEDSIIVGNCRSEAGAAEDFSDSESVLTWSSSNYNGKRSPLGHSHGPSLDNIDYSIKHTRQQGPLINSLASSPPLSQGLHEIEGAEPTVTLLPSGYMTDVDKKNPVEQQNIPSPQLKAPSSLDACATSVVGSGGHSEDSQWIDMIANEYYWDCTITDRDELVVMESKNTFLDEVLFANVPTGQDIPLKRLEDCVASGEIEQPQQEDSLLNSERQNGLQAGGVEKNIPDNQPLVSPMELPTKISLTTPAMKIDLSDDSAWKDFVHKPLGKEIWGDEYEERQVSHDSNGRNWYIFLEDFEGQILSPLRKRSRATTEGPEESDMTVSGSDRALIYAHSNKATIGSFLSSTIATSENGVDHDSSVINSNSPSQIRPEDSFSSLVAHASSLTGETVPILSSGPVKLVEPESTSDTESVPGPVKHAVSISENRIRSATRTTWRGMNDAMIGKDTENKSGTPESTAAIPHSKKITRFRNIFVSVRNSEAREDIDDIEEW